MITTPRVCLALLITFSQLNRQCRDAVDRWFEATLSKLGRLAADLRREFRNTYRISNGISHGYLEKLVREHVRETPTYIAYKKALLAVFDAQTVSSFLLGSFMSFGHFTTDGRRELMSWLSYRCMTCQKRFQCPWDTRVRRLAEQFDRLTHTCHNPRCLPTALITTPDTPSEFAVELLIGVHKSTRQLEASFDRVKPSDLRLDLLAHFATLELQESAQEELESGKQILLWPIPGVPLCETRLGRTKHGANIEKIEAMADGRLHEILDRRAERKQRKTDNELEIRENRVRNLEVNARFELSKVGMTLAAFQAAEKELRLEPAVPHRPLPTIAKLGWSDIRELKLTTFEGNLDCVLKSLV